MDKSRKRSKARKDNAISNKFTFPANKTAYHNMDLTFDLLTKILLSLFAVFLLNRAFSAPLIRTELESNEFPIVAIQYKGSIFLDESDLKNLKEDFPNLGINENTSVDDAYRRLPKIGEGKWYYFYFPIYPFLCLPIKLIFQFIHLDQERCFSVTNAVLVLFSLGFLYKNLRVTSRQKLLAIALLVASPVIYNVNYIYYITFMSAFVTMSLVQYYNKQYKSSALLLSIAGMANCTIMFVGIVMIIEYLTYTVIILLNEKMKWEIIVQYFVKTVCYGVCYLPCLFPFVICRILKIPTFTFRPNEVDNYFYARFLMYLFDPTLGVFSFAPLAMIFFIMTVLIGLFKTNQKSLVWGAMFFGTVASFSLMMHINCGMVYCARYIIFSYPIIPLFLATEGYTIINHVGLKRILYSLIFLSSTILLWVNWTSSGGSGSYNYNSTTRWILNYIPQVYNPYSATFYSRTLHVDGAYSITNPAYYQDPVTGEIRKLIFKADAGQSERVLNDLKGDEKSIEYLQKQLDRIGIDGKFHYVNFPAMGKYHLLEKTKEDKGELTERIRLLEENDFWLINVGEYQIAQFLVNIKENTIYKVELELANDVNFRTAARLITDFYGGIEYDRPQQEASNFILNGRYKYTFYFDTGEFGSDELNVYSRLFVWNLDTDIHIKYFSVTEMENLLVEE